MTSAIVLCGIDKKGLLKVLAAAKIVYHYEVWNTLTKIENLPGLPLSEDERSLKCLVLAEHSMESLLQRYLYDDQSEAEPDLEALR